MTKNSEHLQWLHDRMVNVYGENENVDYLHRFRKIIKEIKDGEDGFEAYLEYVTKKQAEERNDIINNIIDGKD